MGTVDNKAMIKSVNKITDAQKLEIAVGNIPTAEINVYHHYVNEHPELDLKLTDLQVALEIIKIKTRDQMCEFCSASEAKLFRCTKCYLAFYCSRDHQSKHWPHHKQYCCNKYKIDPESPNFITRNTGSGIEVKFGDSYQEIDNIPETFDNIGKMMDAKIIKEIIDDNDITRNVFNRVHVIIYPSISSIYRIISDIANSTDKPTDNLNLSRGEALKIFPNDPLVQIMDNSFYVVIISFCLNSRFETTDTTRFKSVLSFSSRD